MEDTMKKLAEIIVKQQHEIQELNQKIDYLLQNIEIDVNQLESKYQFV